MSAARKKITKKEIKEDKLVTTAFKTTEYIQKNPKPFVIGGVVAAVIFIAVVLMNWSNDKKENTSTILYTQAHLAMDRGDAETAISYFAEIVKDLSNTSNAKLACYTLADIYFEKEDYENALKYYENIITKYNDNEMMSSSAAAGIGSCHRELGELKEAGNYFKMAADLYPDEIAAPMYLLRAMESYKDAGDLESAKLMYNKLSDSYSQTVEAQNAKKSLAELNL